LTPAVALPEFNSKKLGTHASLLSERLLVHNQQVGGSIPRAGSSDFLSVVSKISVSCTLFVAKIVFSNFTRF
jgi:hypothetical protein